MGTTLTDSDLLARLVAFESVSGRDNRPIADFVCDYTDRPGVAVTVIAGPDGAGCNVVATTGTTDRDRGGLVLSGHLDVVPADEPGWESDPFTLAQRNGAYVARGACDMKGFVALAMNRLMRQAGAGDPRPLALVLTDAEELGSLGAQRLAETWGDRPPLPRAAVIGEPTSLRAVRMHKGHLTMRIVAVGAAAHSGSPHLGRNAIEVAGRVLEALGSLRAEWEARRAETSEHFRVVPHPVLNVARIEGGGALNVVPDRCTIELGVRALPGPESSGLASEVEDRARSAAGAEAIEVTVLNDNPPMLLPQEAPIHEALCRLIGQSESIGVSFASDAGVLQRSFGMETVLFGPGTIEVAHRQNEFVPIEEFRRAGDVLDELIRQFCTEEASA